MGFHSETGRLIAAIAALAVSVAPAAAEVCAPDRIDLRGDWGSARFTVEVADTAQSRGQGLMNRPSMHTSAGMLFVYEQPVNAVFWMRNTLIPLDMIFAGPDGVVRNVHANAVPLDETTIDGGIGIKYVLEINGGLADRIGIAPGSEMRHPAIGGDGAAWACAE